MTNGKVCPQCGTKYDAEHRFCQRDGATLVAENPNESLIGAIIADRYHVIEKLGEGGMGEVYLAEHVRIRRKVAVKVMRRWMSADATALGRFHREAENASQISHTNVATIYDFGETGDGMVYFAMEYVDGDPLSALLNREPRLSVVRACYIVRQIADALAAAHALGILHRDLKPDNVLLGKSRNGADHVKIVDFGISRVMNRGTQQFTSTGMVIGTPDYMSPEQLSGDAIDARADNYALALIAFRMLTGVSAYAATNAQESLLARLTRPAQRLRDAASTVDWPESMQAVFDRALSAKPDERFADALEFASALDEAASALPMTDEDERYVQVIRQRSLTPPRVFGTIDANTPPYGAPNVESTPTVARPRVWAPTLAPLQPAAAEAGVGEKAAAEVRRAQTLPDPTATANRGQPPSATASGSPARGYARWAIGGGAALAGALVLARFLGTRGPTLSEAAPVADSAAVAPASAAADSLSNLTAATPMLTSDAVVSRASRSVFAVSSPAGHGAGFLADSSGLVVTSANLVPDDRVLAIQVDDTHRFRAPVVLAENGLAIALLPVPVCRGCQPLSFANDNSVVSSGDSVVAIGSPESSGRVKRGVIETSTGSRFAASFEVGARHAGAPLASLAGTVIAVATRGRSGQPTLTPASVAAALLVRARQSLGRTVADTALLPVWPAGRIAEATRSRGLLLTDADLAAYRMRDDGFEVLVMTPQVMAWRRKLASQPSASPDNPFAVGPTRNRRTNAISDPIQRWTEWDEYWRERRAVVVIDVSPEATRPPFLGGEKPVDFRNGDAESLVLMRDNQPVPDIESSRYPAVPDTEAYGGRAVYRSMAAVFPPLAFATGEKFRLEVRDASRRGKAVAIEIPSRTIARLRADLSGFLGR
ncbi:MAG: Serine/threonine-protein kinase PknD [Gemmatimonadaceae bacterium]|nr:Serine/threonine-protein kinase PknD [Gemmatimonadaceae bacterium]